MKQFNEGIMKQIDIFGNEVDLDDIPIPQQKGYKKT